MKMPPAPDQVFFRRYEPDVVYRLIKRIAGKDSPVPGLLFLLVLVVAVFRDHIFSGYTFPWDFLATSHMAVWVANTAGAGNFTEWNPFLGGGFPLPANALSMLYFPLWWLLGLLRIPPTVTVQTIIQVAHVWLGAAGVLFLARSRGIHWKWGLLAATAFVFYGGFYGSGSHENIFRGHAYAPWLLWVLTLPEGNKYPRRLLLLPPFIWILATGSYAGQSLGFLQLGAVYFLGEMWRARRTRNLRKLLSYAVPAALSGAAIFVAVFLPSFATAARGQLYRPFPPTGAERAIWALKPIDLFGLYLDPFAWSGVDGTVRAWGVGVVVLVGLACVNRQILTRHLPLVVAGLAALVLAALPAWTPAGNVMVKIPAMFPSRLAASDYKAVIAVTLVVLAALGWQRVVTEGRVVLPALVAGAALLAGLLLPLQQTEIPATKTPWLVAGLTATAVVFACRPDSWVRWLPAAIVLGMVVDGGRMVTEMELYPTLQPWSTPADGYADRELHDSRARDLRNIVKHPPDRRPARLPQAGDPSIGGNGADAWGYLADAYRLGDYSGAVTIERWRMTQSPQLTELMLRPWTAWTIPCETVDCGADSLELGPEMLREESAGITTTSYGLDYIDYRVRLPEKTLMVENEFGVPGWTADRAGIRPVKIGGVLRGWVLPAGNYEFRASYMLPDRPAQLLLSVLAALGLLAAIFVYRRVGRPGPLPAPPDTAELDVAPTPALQPAVAGDLRAETASGVGRFRKLRLPLRRGVDDALP